VPTMSEFERLTDALLVASGIEPPVRQHPVDLPDGTRAFIDLAWPARMVGLECDGLFDHGTDLRLPWDDSRQNQLQLLGWLILRTTWHELRGSPGTLIAHVRAGLERAVSGSG
jgi:very-short-patch-repair endonuclease